MSSVEIREYLRPLIKWWWLLAAATLVAALSSFVYTMLQPAVYEARTTLMVGSTIEDPEPQQHAGFSDPTVGRNLCRYCQTHADQAGDYASAKYGMAAVLRRERDPEYTNYRDPRL